jgi:hypothetical protein
MKSKLKRQGLFEQVADSRRKPKVGDIFGFKLKPNHMWMFGRVVELNYDTGFDFPGTLVYLFKYSHPEPTLPDKMPVTDLLVGPVVVSSDPWQECVFRVFDNRQFHAGERLNVHYFGVSSERDSHSCNLSHATIAREPVEMSSRIPPPPHGIAGLYSLMGIEALVAESLGLPRDQWYDYVYGEYGRKPTK